MKPETYAAGSLAILLCFGLFFMGKLFIWILVPFLNIYLLLQKGDEEKNKYGEVPV